MKKSALLAVLVAAGLSAAIWALSVPLTGKAEPWDAESPYYFAGLAVAGGVSGAIVRGHLWAHYLGALLGQLAYELAFLKLGPLFVVGLLFLAGCSLIFLASAALMSSFGRDRGEGEPPQGPLRGRP